MAITQAYGANEAIALAIEAGVDPSCSPTSRSHDEQVVEHAIATIVEVVDTGRIGEARLDDPVARIEALFATVE